MSTMRASEIPPEVERQYRDAGVEFRQVAAGKYLIVDSRTKPARYRGPHYIWRTVPAAVRNYFDSAQEAFQSFLEEETGRDHEEIDIAGIFCED